ncbi:hypothetical protein H3146_26125 [Streptomyces sp. OF3]|uniref:Peptidase inhibitor family I36 protein n=1 Tax=Streptomyces alkaliterrae TaxID=2213162 RepID=A0A7W3ZQM0_9ACTN|nr:hypothetical protein [Streptomyces alkaliterrae]MBB1256796.1 hypothetical protein [Streptomyces alkaliterrae]
MKKRGVFVSALAAFGLLMGGSGTAQAGSFDTGGCRSGHVCVWTADGKKYSYEGSFSGSIKYVTHIFNNGKRWPGADHIYYSGTHHGKKVSGCLHYWDQPFHVKDSPFPPPDRDYAWECYCGATGNGMTLTSLRWGPECG